MRKLAHIEKITWKKPIEGADRIELVGVLGWQCIAKKDEFQIGDTCVYIEIDSIVDKTNPDFAFLQNKHYKIKTMKMRGVLSQGIVFPTSILSGKKYEIGDDVTKELKITQIEDEIPKETPDKLLSQFKQRHKKLSKNKLFQWFMKFSWFRKLMFKTLLKKKGSSHKFPDWIIKTDETRIQNMPWVISDYAGKPMVVTEKIDGTSTTFGLRKEKKRKEFVVCSRNVRQATPSQKCFYDDNVYHIIAKKFDIEEVLKRLMDTYKAKMIVLQGETIGEGIQKNKYGIKGFDFYAFNLIIDGKKIDSCEASEIVKAFGIKWVPILDKNFILLPSIEEMLAYTESNSVLKDTLREGVVIRDHENTTSFKCISNAFLLKHNL